jgi:hypothetical protein
MLNENLTFKLHAISCKSLIMDSQGMHVERLRLIIKPERAKKRPHCCDL